MPVDFEARTDKKSSLIHGDAFNIPIIASDKSSNLN
jgi:hypothetical protein